MVDWVGEVTHLQRTGGEGGGGWGVERGREKRNEYIIMMYMC